MLYRPVSVIIGFVVLAVNKVSSPSAILRGGSYLYNNERKEETHLSAIDLAIMSLLSTNCMISLYTARHIAMQVVELHTLFHLHQVVMECNEAKE